MRRPTQPFPIDDFPSPMSSLPNVSPAMRTPSAELLHRREFLQFLLCGIVTSAPSIRRANAEQARTPIRAIAFDGFAVFDPRPVAVLAEEIAPGHGTQLVAAWRSRQFEYQWLRTLGGRYTDFRRTSEDGLRFAARSLGLPLTDDARARLLDAQSTLVPWPDAGGTIRALRAARIRLAFVSNMTERMLEDGAQRAGFRGAFEHVLSTDRVRAAKPDPRAYRMALDAFELRRDQVAFVAFADWDAAGATWFGYPTVWTNRLTLPPDELDAQPALIAHNLVDVVEFVTQRR
jgi:2-haloacid dehalogenase